MAKFAVIRIRHAISTRKAYSSINVLQQKYGSKADEPSVNWHRNNRVWLWLTSHFHTRGYVIKNLMCRVDKRHGLRIFPVHTFTKKNVGKTGNSQA